MRFLVVVTPPSIYHNPTFEDTSFNILIRIGILELLLNLVYFHGFMKKQNPTVILNLQTPMIKNYLSEGLYIIEQGIKQFIFLPNDVILRINLNNKLDTDYVMVKNKAISAVKNTIKQLYIQKDMQRK